jgi:transposase
MYRDAKQWQQIRRNILENGVPKKRISRETSISRRTINKMLTHEHPPSYGPRQHRYPKLGPYIHRINELLLDNGSFSLSPDMTIQDVVHLLGREEGFAGSYDSVRNYIRHLTREDNSAWESARDLMIRLSKPSAIEFLQLLSRGNSPEFTSAQIKQFVRKAACPHKPTNKPGREGQRLVDMEWMRRVLQNEVDEDTLDRELDGIPELSALLRQLHNGRLSDRNRSMAALASHRKIPSQTICAFLGVGKAFVRKYRNKFDSMGATIMFAPQTKSKRKADNEDLRGAVFKLLHEPPVSHGINRTSLTMALLSKILKENGRQVGIAVLAKMIKGAGYKWRKAKIVLTSNDPTYLEKLSRIRSILSNLQPDEAFFSIDEFGPFAIKMKPGRTLAPPGFQPTVPQWQKSRGCLIMTAALELSSNQVAHFYSAKKNTDEMIRMMEALINKYPDRRKLYLSWDAASW